MVDQLHGHDLAVIPEARQRAAGLLVTVLEGGPFSPLEVVALCAAVLEETDDQPLGVVVELRPGENVVGGEVAYSAAWL